MPLDRLLTGHGDPVIDARRASSSERFAEHRRRCAAHRRACSRDGPATAFEIARHLWSPRTVAEQPLLVVWEVLGHLDLLLDAGAVAEHVDDGRLPLRFAARAAGGPRATADSAKRDRSQEARPDASRHRHRRR